MPVPSGTTRSERFLLNGYHGQPTAGRVTIQVFDRALRKWWGIAFVSVFIPVAHFILVPSFLAYGGWQFFKRLGTAELATDARGTCPDCGAEQGFRSIRYTARSRFAIISRKSPRKRETNCRRYSASGLNGSDAGPATR